MHTIIEQIYTTIEDAKRRSGRSDEVKLVAVSKNHPYDKVAEALGNGLTCFGENRVQEILEKFPESRTGYQVRMIGHLQTNKVKLVVPRVDAIDSVDSLKLLRTIDRESGKAGKVMPVLLQVNTSEEASKSGFLSLDDICRTLDASFDLLNIRIEGLMTIGPLTDDTKRIRTAFAALKEMQSTLCDKYPSVLLRELSMGMSDDYPLAVEMGSTMVRIGSMIFGARKYL